MGRGLILFIVGMFIIMGIFNFASQNRLLSSEEDMAQQVHYSIASAAALSGLEMASQAFIIPSTLEPGEEFNKTGHILNRNHDGTDITVTLLIDEDNPNRIRLRSEGLSQGVQSVIVGDYRIQSSGSLPVLEAAMGFYNPIGNLTINGRAFTINGCDHPRGVEDITNCNGEDDVHGIAVYGDENMKIVKEKLEIDPPKNNPKGDKVTGKNGMQDVEEAGKDGTFIQEFIDEILLSTPRSELLIDALGPDGVPRVSHIRGNVSLTGKNNSAGIIIVEEGATLNVSGNFNFEGLILSRGTISVASGNFDLWGGIIFGGNPKLDIFEDDPFPDAEHTLNGNIDIRYSSEALRWIDQSLSESFGQRLVLLGQFTDSQ